MTRRRPGKPTASERIIFNVTPEEAGRIRGLAYYLRVPTAEMLRNLCEEKREQLIAEGKRPPVRPPEQEG